MFSIFYILVAVITIIVLWIKKKFIYWKDRGFLQTDAEFPFGSYKGLGSSQTSFQVKDAIYRKFKGKCSVIGVYSFLTPGLLPIDPEMIKNIYVKDFKSFNYRGMFYNEKDDPLSKNILTLEYHDWRNRRVKFTPLFTSGKMKMMFEIVDGIGDRLAAEVGRQIQRSECQELRNWSQRFSTDSIVNVAFGIECNSIADPENEIFKHGRRVFNLSTFEIIQMLFSASFPDIARKLGFRFVVKEPAEFFLNTFLQTFEYYQRNNITRNDFISLLLGLKDSFTPTELAAEAFLVLAGGYETSSTLISFTLYELAMNSDMQDRLRDELVTGIEENDGKLTYDLLFGFKYLDMVVNESLRKYPPIPDIPRMCSAEYKIPGTDLIIPKGTMIETTVYSFHHDPEYFPEPEKFDPERFSKKNVKNIVPNTFFPFGDGPRNCLGMRYGLMQSKIGIAKMISNFKFTLNSKTITPIEFNPSSPVVAPKGGLWLNVEKIQ